MRRVYSIKYGKHYSRPFRPRIHFGIDCATVTVRPYDLFYDSNKLPIEDREDVNKLWGFSCGHHHKNSIRIGWYCAGNEIHFMLYAYSFGKRIIKPIGSMDRSVSDQKITFVINRVSGYTYEVGIKGCKLNLLVDIDFWYGYILKPYFGGNNPAVKHFNIDIEYHICERQG